MKFFKLLSLMVTLSISKSLFSSSDCKLTFAPPPGNWTFAKEAGETRNIFGLKGKSQVRTFIIDAKGLSWMKGLKVLGTIEFEAMSLEKGFIYIKPKEKTIFIKLNRDSGNRKKGSYLILKFGNKKLSNLIAANDFLFNLRLAIILLKSDTSFTNNKTLKCKIDGSLSSNKENMSLSILKNLISEITQTEYSYLRSLRRVKLFLNYQTKLNELQLKGQIITGEDIKLLFDNHLALLRKLSRQNPITDEKTLFSATSKTCKALVELVESNSWQSQMNNFSRSFDKEKTLTKTFLANDLITPIQRAPRYVLLLNEMIKALTAQKDNEKSSHANMECNEALRKVKAATLTYGN